MLKEYSELKKITQRFAVITRQKILSHKSQKGHHGSTKGLLSIAAGCGKQGLENIIEPLPRSTD